jgi:anti-sigma regulatory factor (Ser/Thr protein kinase)
METLLTQWLGGTQARPILDEGSAALAREWVREAGRAQGLGPVEIEQLALATSELVHNQLDHARGGAVAVRPVWRGGVAGVEVLAVDRGPGIANPAEALHGRINSTGSLGAGVSGVLRQADEVDVDVRWQEGTCVRARKYVRPPAPRCEVGVLGQPCSGEQVSGDQAAWSWDEAGLLATVVDGLGHGWAAREAADVAVHAVLTHSDQEPRRILEYCDGGLRETRGAAMAVVRLGYSGLLRHICIGNVATLMVGPRRHQFFTCLPGAAGMPHQRIDRGHECMVQDERSLLIMYTDGLSEYCIPSDPALLYHHPLEVASHLLTRYARQGDDALVLVARVR